MKFLVMLVEDFMEKKQVYGYLLMDYRVVQLMMKDLRFGIH